MFTIYHDAIGQSYRFRSAFHNPDETLDWNGDVIYPAGTFFVQIIDDRAGEIIEAPVERIAEFLWTDFMETEELFVARMAQNRRRGKGIMGTDDDGNAIYFAP